MDFSVESPSKITSNAAESVAYDNTSSGLDSDNVQAAIDELRAQIQALEAFHP